MRNPVTALKAVFSELLQHGRRAVALAEDQAARLENQAARLDRVEACLTAAQVREAEARAALDSRAEHQAARLDGIEARFEACLTAAQVREAEARAALGSRLDEIVMAIDAGRAQFTAAVDERMSDVGTRIGALERLLSPPPDDRHYFGLDDLDRRLEAYLDYDNGFFVELGANDGVAQSNTLHFERFRGWRGILVEPTPHNFLRCLQNRAEATQVFCAACTAFDYRDRFVEIAFSNLMSTPIGLDSDILDPLAHARTGERFLKAHERVFTFGAPARPLNDLLVEGRAPARIDLLSLDVEGAELEVLRGIDHKAFRFRFICVESRDLGRISAYLSAQGYELVQTLTHHDHLFRDRDWSAGAA